MRLKKEDIRFLIVHQSATPKNDTSFAQIKKYHVWQGMGNIAYHYFIEADGKVKRGRNESTAGTHTKAGHMNEKSIGICLAGNFNTEEPNPGQLQSLERVLRSLLIRYKLQPDDIFAHREVPGAVTECPGDSLNVWLVDFREKLNREMG